MKNRKTSKYLILVGLFSLASVVFPASLRAQAPPGPITPASPPPSDDSQPAPQPKADSQPLPPATRANLNGSWKLNSDESDDGREKMRQSRSSQNNGNGGNGGGGGRGGVWGGGPGIGFPGSGGGGGGVYGRHGGNGNDSESSEDRVQMQELIDPPVRIQLSQKDNEFDLSDDTNNKRAFYTDGRKLKKSKDMAYQEIAAHWEDTRLVSDEKTSHEDKISRTFEPQPGGKKLVELVRIENNRRQSSVEIRFVYDLVPENKS